MIPVCEPLILDQDRAYARDAIESGWISSDGHYLRTFEERWAAYCGVRHGVAMCNGTVALEAAVAALELEPGSEIILPSFTIISCVLAVLEAGCVPVLVDSEPDTWCMDVRKVAERITPRTRAIMPVHMYGHTVDMEPLWELAAQHGLKIVEDAAEAHGADYRGRRAGSLGDLGCFSFYANKIVTTGEGGMVVTNDDALAERLRSLRNLCFQPPRRFLHARLGHNYRMTNVQAALGVAQVERVEDHVARKRRMAVAYGERLASLQPRIHLPVERSWGKNVYWMYGLVLGDEVPFDAQELARRLRELGVDTRPFFVGMHEQPALLERGLFKGEWYPVADRLARRGLYLPSGLGITAGQIETVSEAVHKVLA